MRQLVIDRRDENSKCAKTKRIILAKDTKSFAGMMCILPLRNKLISRETQGANQKMNSTGSRQPSYNSEPEDAGLYRRLFFYWL